MSSSARQTEIRSSGQTTVVCPSGHRQRYAPTLQVASDIYTGSNFVISQRSFTLSRLTRTEEAVSVGASLPMVTV